MSGPLFNHSLLSQIASLLDGDDDDDSLEHSPLAVSEHPPIVSYTLRYVSLFIVRYVTSSYRVLPLEIQLVHSAGTLHRRAAKPLSTPRQVFVGATW